MLLILFDDFENSIVLEKNLGTLEDAITIQSRLPWNPKQIGDLQRKLKLSLFAISGDCHQTETGLYSFLSPLAA